MNLAAVIESHPAGARALISRGRTTTYGELAGQTARLRAGLVGLGLEPGDQVAIACGTNWDFAVSFLAVTGAGLVAVPLNPAQPAAETQARLGQVRCRAAIVGPTGAGSFRHVDRAAVPDLEHVIVTDVTDVTDVADGPAGALALGDVMAAGVGPPVVPRLDDDLAVLLFTSGTAGAPRAAMLTHGNLLANVGAAQAVRPDPVVADDVALCLVPLFHVFGLSSILLTALAAGAAVVLVERFDPVSAIAAIGRHAVTVVAGPPQMWTAFADQPDAGPEHFASLRIATSGAQALPRSTFDAMRDRMDVVITEGYGLTEASPTVSVDVGSPVTPGSVGRPLPGVEVRLVDDEGHDALVGDAGRLRVRGRSVFAGYWGDPDATRDVLDDDGWLLTGDVAVADSEGRLYLVDRANDLIIVSGFNVYPAEVEEVVEQHPAVARAAVVGNPHATTGESVVAHVQLREGAAAEEDDIIDFCERRLARYKAPGKVWFHDELPIGPTGKLLRRELGAGTDLT